MRLADMTRPGRDDGEIPAEVERELEALNAALRGEKLPDGMESLEALVSDLRDERPEPEPRFEAELDAWAAAGFPRSDRPGARASGDGSGAKTGFFSRFSPYGPRGWSPIAATAATLVVIVVSVAQLGDFGADNDQPTMATQSEDSPGDAAVPEQEAATEETADGSAVPFSESDEGTRALESQGDLSERNAAFGRPGLSRGQERRRVDREAELTLATPADEVPDVTNDAIDVVEDANGVVLNSRVTGTEEEARATLELQVPTETLDDTLAALSELADVKSRSEDAVDITRSFVAARDDLRGLRAERVSLVGRIRAATTDAEVDALQAQLAAVNNQIVNAQNELAEVETRAQFSDVSLVITSDGAQVGGEEDEGGWSFGDALGDAGRVLEVGAGVALISAAVLFPLAIIAAIAYITVAAMNRRARERALDT